MERERVCVCVCVCVCVEELRKAWRRQANLKHELFGWAVLSFSALEKKRVMR